MLTVLEPILEVGEGEVHSHSQPDSTWPAPHQTLHSVLFSTSVSESDWLGSDSHLNPRRRCWSVTDSDSNTDSPSAISDSEIVRGFDRQHADKGFGYLSNSRPSSGSSFDANEVDRTSSASASSLPSSLLLSLSSSSPSRSSSMPSMSYTYTTTSPSSSSPSSPSASPLSYAPPTPPKTRTPRYLLRHRRTTSSVPDPASPNSSATSLHHHRPTSPLANSFVPDEEEDGYFGQRSRHGGLDDDDDQTSTGHGMGSSNGHGYNTGYGYGYGYTQPSRSQPASSSTHGRSLSADSHSYSSSFSHGHTHTASVDSSHTPRQVIYVPNRPSASAWIGSGITTAAPAPPVPAPPLALGVQPQPHNTPPETKPLVLDRSEHGHVQEWVGEGHGAAGQEDEREDDDDDDDDDEMGPLSGSESGSLYHTADEDEDDDEDEDEWDDHERNAEDEDDDFYRPKVEEAEAGPDPLSLSHLPEYNYQYRNHHLQQEQDPQPLPHDAYLLGSHETYSPYPSTAQAPDGIFNIPFKPDDLVPPPSPGAQTQAQGPRVSWIDQPFSFSSASASATASATASASGSRSGSAYRELTPDTDVDTAKEDGGNGYEAEWPLAYLTSVQMERGRGAGGGSRKKGKEKKDGKETNAKGGTRMMKVLSWGRKAKVVDPVGVSEEEAQERRRAEEKRRGKRKAEVVEKEMEVDADRAKEKDGEGAKEKEKDRKRRKLQKRRTVDMSVGREKKDVKEVEQKVVEMPVEMPVEVEVEVETAQVPESEPEADHPLLDLEPEPETEYQPQFEGEEEEEEQMVWMAIGGDDDDDQTGFETEEEVWVDAVVDHVSEADPNVDVDSDIVHSTQETGFNIWEEVTANDAAVYPTLKGKEREIPVDDDEYVMATAIITAPAIDQPTASTSTSTTTTTTRRQSTINSKSNSKSRPTSKLTPTPKKKHSKKKKKKSQLALKTRSPPPKKPSIPTLRPRRTPKSLLTSLRLGLGWLAASLVPGGGGAGGRGGADAVRNRKRLSKQLKTPNTLLLGRHFSEKYIPRYPSRLDGVRRVEQRVAKYE